MYGGTILAHVIQRRGRVRLPHKRHKRHLMPLGKIAKHIIGACLGACIKRIRKNLRQEENPHGGSYSQLSDEPTADPLGR
jgi:hypothetical protein